MSFFQAGDTVTVRPDLMVDHTYYNEDGLTCDIAVSEMVKHAGETVRISKVYFGEKYGLFEIGYQWTDEMFVEYLERDKVCCDEQDVDLQSHDEFLAFLAG